MNGLQKMFVERASDERADELLLSTAIHAMECKLEKKRNEGFGGWHGPECSNEKLKAMLIEHIEKDDMVDIMNFAAMIFVREKLYGNNA